MWRLLAAVTLLGVVAAPAKAFELSGPPSALSGTISGTYTLGGTPTIVNTVSINSWQPFAQMPAFFSGGAHTINTNNWIVNGGTPPNTTQIYLNLGLGPNALAVNVNGDENVAVGTYALQSFTGGASPGLCGAGNVAVGVNSQGLNVSGCTNVSVGTDSLSNMTSASNDNVAVGASAAGGDDIGSSNVAVGSGALNHGTNARAQNTVSGFHALFGQAGVTASTRMTVSGYNAVAGATLGSPARDVITGDNAANGASYAGTDSVISGSFAGNKLTGAANSLTLLGSAVALNATTPTHSILIGDNIEGTNFLNANHKITICTLGSSCDDNTSNKINIENVLTWTGTGTASTSVPTIHGAVTLPDITTGTNADVLCVDAGNIVRLQAAASCTISSMRFKRDIEPVAQDQSLRTIMGLRTSTFYRLGQEDNPDTNATRQQIGLIAENVAQVEPRLAIYEPDMRTVKSWHLDGMIAELVGAVQAQQREIDGLHRYMGYR